MSVLPVKFSQVKFTDKVCASVHQQADGLQKIELPKLFGEFYFYKPTFFASFHKASISSKVISDKFLPCFFAPCST